MKEKEPYKLKEIRNESWGKTTKEKNSIWNGRKKPYN